MRRNSGQAIATFIRLFPRLTYFAYVQHLRKELKDCATCLEIGCGNDSPARLLGFSRYVGIDGYGPAIEHARTSFPSGEYHVGRAEDVLKRFEGQTFDCVIALDLIEHLTKEAGLTLIADMERLAKKKILLFTPNGYLPQCSRDGDLQEHLSGWTVGEMRTLGFRVIGMHGPKLLRGPQHAPRVRPAVLGSLLAELGQLVTRHVPSSAAAILCVKKMDK